MDHVLLPQGGEGEVRIVLTADTMSTDLDGVVHGKPVSRQDAIHKIKTLRRGGVVATAFCLDKKCGGLMDGIRKSVFLNV